jgi:predicted nucleic acid-binding protein
VSVAYLLDTNVVSELRKKRPHGAVLAWFRALTDEQVHLSAVTVGEIQSGIELTREHDPAKAQEIQVWLNTICESYNILALDAAAFQVWAKLKHRKSDTLTEDAMIAAVAKVNGLVVATRNVADFVALGVQVMNPFEV